MELEQLPAGTFRFDEQGRVLELVWSAMELSEDDVKQMLARFAEHAGAHPESNLLVDVRHFRFSWGPKMDSWRDATVIPVYNDAGVRKFAFLVPEGAPAKPPARIAPALFETGMFTSREAAEAWFRESQRAAGNP
jgi:SpoIIAA-like